LAKEFAQDRLPSSALWLCVIPGRLENSRASLMKIFRRYGLLLACVLICGAAADLFLVRGNRQELLQRVDVLGDALSKTSPDQLKANEITEEDRPVQISLYEKLSASLRAGK